MEIGIETRKREEIVDITKDVKEAVQKLLEESGVKEGKNGACLIYTPHATCAVIVNENYDEAVCEDILSYLKEQIPQGVWEHDKIDSNADAHIKASILGPGKIIPINEGKIQLGRWQGVGLAEFDGPRRRKVIVKIL